MVNKLYEDLKQQQQQIIEKYTVLEEHISQ